MTEVSCVTKFVGKLLIEFIDASFPEKLHIRPVEFAGADAANAKLGTAWAAKSLRVTGTLDEIKPCF
jgi:hypothetical protein